MRFVLGLVLLASLSSCGPTARQAVAACEIEAIKMYPDEPTSWSMKRDHLVHLCMDAKGFRFNGKPKACEVEANLDPSMEDTCYEPAS